MLILPLRRVVILAGAFIDATRPNRNGQDLAQRYKIFADPAHVQPAILVNVMREPEATRLQNCARRSVELRVILFIDEHEIVIQSGFQQFGHKQNLSSIHWCYSSVKGSVSVPSNIYDSHSSVKPK